MRAAECEDTSSKRNGELIFPSLSTLENCVYWRQWAGMGGGERKREGERARKREKKLSSPLRRSGEVRVVQ